MKQEESSQSIAELMKGERVINRAMRRRKPTADPRFTKKRANRKSDADSEAIRQRVLRKEKGEQERIAKKKAEQNAK